MDHAIIINRGWYLSETIHTLLGVYALWKVQIQPKLAFDSADGEIRCLYESVNNTKYFQYHMESLFLHTVSPTVHWEDNTSFISLVKSNIVTPIIKHINIPVCFLQDQYYNVLYITNYDKFDIIIK